jgi:hypothetical protein
MRVRLRRLLTLVSGGHASRPGYVAQPRGAGPQADDARRRLDAARQRLKQTIPPPEDAAP